MVTDTMEVEGTDRHVAVVPSSGARRALAFDAMGAPCAVLDRRGEILETNAAWRLFAALNGAGAEHSGVGTNYLEACDRSTNEDATAAATGIRQILDGERQQLELEYSCHSSNERRWFLLHAAAAPAEQGGGVTIVHTNITARKEMEHQFDVSADIESSSHLPNRSALIRFLDRALAEKADADQRVGVMIVELEGVSDADDFDARGTAHDLLAQLAARGRRIVRAEDLFCHLGGNVFAIAWRHADEAAQVGLVARIVIAMKAPFHVGTSEIFLEVVVGNSISDPSSTGAMVLAKAERSVVVTRVARRRGLLAAPIGPELPESSPADDRGSRGTGRPATFVVDLADNRLRQADDQAQRLFAQAALPLVGRHIATLIDDTASSGTYLALAALSAGAIQTFRGHCTLRGVDRPVPAWVSVRAMHFRSGSAAVWTVLPDGAPCSSDPSASPFFRPGVELVSGSVGVDLRVASVEASHECVEATDVGLRTLVAAGSLQRADASLLASVHPDDAHAVRTAHVEAMSGRHAATTPLRWFHPEGGWFNAHLTLFATGIDDPAESVAFVLTEAPPLQSGPNPDVRVARLERLLAHIAAEAHGAGNLDVATQPEEPIDWSRLDQMSTRQREVVKRLVHGERVPSIAKAMFISRSTVRNHLSGAFRSCGVNSQSDLVQLFLSPGAAPFLG